jgi:hypothetical protein
VRQRIGIWLCAVNFRTMENYKNLLEVIEKSNEEISYYLEDVSVEQFKKDVLELAKMNTDKQIISEMIKKLQAML